MGVSKDHLYFKWFLDVAQDYEFLNILFITFYDVSEILDVCDASKNDWSCCNPSKPCGVGEGDFDKDSDCSGNLECGTNNCKSFNSAWSSIGFDCCTEG